MLHTLQWCVFIVKYDLSRDGDWVLIFPWATGSQEASWGSHRRQASWEMETELGLRAQCCLLLGQGAFLSAPSFKAILWAFLIYGAVMSRTLAFAMVFKVSFYWYRLSFLVRPLSLIHGECDCHCYVPAAVAVQLLSRPPLSICTQWCDEALSPWFTDEVSPKA